jgi:hypothetical protein
LCCCWLKEAKCGSLRSQMGSIMILPGKIY